MDRLRGGLGAVFSQGPGYEPQPPGSFATFDEVSGYYVDLRQKAIAPLRPRRTARGEVAPPGPTALAQRALGLYDRYLAGQDDTPRAFLDSIDALLACATRSDGFPLWYYSVAVPKYARTAPWLSCMAQGQAASALTRAFLLTGDQQLAEDAERAALAVAHFGAQQGLLVPTHAGPIPQECPSDPPSHILNGWIYFLWGLSDVARALKSSEAMSLFDRCTEALRLRIKEYDLGWWSRYSLYPPASPDLAKPFYHRIHVVQMQMMYRMTHLQEFNDVSVSWRRALRLRNVTRAVALLSARAATTRRP